MSSVQHNSGDLIEFNSAENVLDKPNGGIVQKIVMGETESATLIATAVAKLTSSSVTVKPTIATIPAKSESDPIGSNPAATVVAYDPNGQTTVTVVISPATAATTQIDTSSNVPSSDSSQSSQVNIPLIFIYSDTQS